MLIELYDYRWLCLFSDLSNSNLETLNDTIKHCDFIVLSHISYHVTSHHNATQRIIGSIISLTGVLLRKAKKCSIDLSQRYMYQLSFNIST